MKIVEIQIKKLGAQLSYQVKLTSLMTSFYARIILSVFGIAAIIRTLPNRETAELVKKIVKSPRFDFKEASKFSPKFHGGGWNSGRL